MTRQLIIALALVGMVLLILLAGPAACNKIRSMGAQARVDSAQSNAASNSAADAVGTVARSGEASAASEAVTRDNEREIRAAPGADQRVNSGVDAAGRAALCRRDAYRNSRECKEMSQ